MSGYARVAVGSWGERPNPGPICWALAGCLERRGRRVRHFLSHACYGAPQGAVTSTGRASQYLDCWLSSTDACRAQLAEAYASADFVLAEGWFPSREPADDRRGGDLATLAHRLDLPRVVVLDAASAADCRLPPRPDAVDGVILDGVLDAEQFARLQVCVEAAWGVPVVAAMERDEGLRQQLVCLPPARTVAHELVDALTQRMDGYLQLAALEAIAHRPSLPQPTASASRPEPRLSRRSTVALAYDDAFCGYFADVLERLEHLGVRVVDFSPLADEGLPDGVDAVLVGCGRPEEFAERLAANHCMRTALRDFARRGGVVYSEGGGTAYLARTLVAADGRTLPMVDALPLTARVGEREPWEPVEFTLGGRGLPGPPGTRVRGYRGGRYRFEPVEPCVAPARELPHDLYASGNVIGGRLQLHFLAQPALLHGLFDRREDYYAVVG